MDTIRTDRRRIEAQPDTEGERLAAATAAEYLDVRLRLARILVRLGARRTYSLSGCSSVVHFAVRLGIPTAEARILVDLGRAIDTPVDVLGAGSGAAAAGSVEDRVRAGTLSAENAALAGKLLAKPGLIVPGENWLGAAETMSAPQLRHRVNERLEQAAQGEPAVVPVTVHVPVRTRDDFGRARVLASREAGAALTEGQTFALIVDRFLDATDERLRGPGTRRVGATSELTGDRYVPAAVRRAVLERSGDRCEVAGCTHRIFLELAHIEGHARGGSREAENLVRLCHAHHTQFDAGCIRIACWREGRPVFVTARGAEIGVRAVVDAGQREASGGTDHDARTPESAARGSQPLADSVDERSAERSATDPAIGSSASGLAWSGDERDGSTQVSERPPPPWSAPENDWNAEIVWGPTASGPHTRRDGRTPRGCPVGVRASAVALARTAV